MYGVYFESIRSEEIVFWGLVFWVFGRVGYGLYFLVFFDVIEDKRGKL